MPLTKRRKEREKEIQKTPEKEDGIPRNQAIVNWNHTTGVVVDEALGGYPTYRIRLRDVDKIFEGKTQSWDKDYKNAQKIFGDGMKCKARRGAIHAKHKSMYKGVANRVETAVVEDGDSFIHLLNDGRCRYDEILLYTFVIVDDIIWFGPTGDKLLKDIVSKHALHSNCAEEVTYSGEFFLFKKEDTNENDDMILVMNNGSGTYKPDKKMLPKLKELFEENFPGLNIEVFDQDDEKMREYEEKVKKHNKSLDTKLFHHFGSEKSE